MTTQLRLWFLLSALVPLGALAQKPTPRETIDPLPFTAKAAGYSKVTAGPSTANGVAATCAVTTSLDFGQRPDGEDWKNHAAVVVGASPRNTTIETAGTYVEPAGGTETTLAVEATTNNNLKVPNLYWYTNYTSRNNSTTQITYSFNRPVNSFSLTLLDVDRNTSNFIDAVTLDAYQADGTTLKLGTASEATVANNTAYTSVSGNTITGTQQNTDGESNGTVTVTFNKPITRFIITYRNTYNIADPGVQYIGITGMSWCTQANVATTLTGPARALPGAQVTYTVSTTANGDYAASGVKPVVQLSPGLNSQSPEFPVGSSYNNTTGLLTLASIPTLNTKTTSSSIIKFNMPNSTVTGTASSTIDTDDSDPTDNNGSLAAASVTTTVNQVPTAQAKSATVSANTAVYTDLPAMTGTDPDNDALTYTIDGSSIGNIGFGTIYYTNNETRTAISGTSNVTLTAAQVSTLEFQGRTGVALGNTGTLRYSVSDAFGGTSSLVGYTITVADQPAVYSSPNIFQRASLVDNQVLASVTDPDGTISSASYIQIAGTTQTRIVFNTTTGRFTANIGNGNGQQPAAGTYTYRVTTRDSRNGTTVSDVTITILSSDNAAVYSANNQFNRDALTSGMTLATVTDSDAPVTSATLVSGPLANSMTLNAATGQITVNATSVPFTGNYSYTVTTRDAAGGTSTAVPVTITVFDDNEAAYTATQTFNRDVLTAGQSLATASDADGTIASASVTAGFLPAGTALNATSGQFTVSDPSKLANGNYSFTVSTVDNTGGRSTLGVGVNLFETEAVYAMAAAPSGVYTNGYSLATVSDVDGAITNAVLVNSSTLPAGVSLNGTTGQFTVTNRLLLKEGSYPVQVTTKDATGGLTAQSITIVIKSNPLPIQLASFTAKAVGQDAQLVWRTAQELNNDHFVVERSFDGTNFSAIGQVKGQGTTTTATDYKLTDAQVAAKAQGQTVYYRLRQVDTDGTSTFSAVQTTRFGAVEVTINVAPNPAVSQATLELNTMPEGTYLVTVRDVTGRLVYQTSAKGGLNQDLPVGQWPAGIYLIKVKGQAAVKTARLIKE